MDVNESDDALVRGRPREHREHREQQQRGERIASALRAAWITDLGERGQQERERHQAISTRADAVQTEIRYATMQPLAVKPLASNCLPELQGPGVRIDLRPRSPRDLADIDIAVRVDRE